MVGYREHALNRNEEMAKMIFFEAKKAHIFFPFIIDVCKPGRGRLVGGIILLTMINNPTELFLMSKVSIKAMKCFF